MEIGLLISGNLGFSVFKHVMNAFKVSFVLTDKGSNSIIGICEEKKILHYVGNPRQGRALKAIGTVTCDVIVSVNYLFLIEKDIIQLPQQKLAINFHGSLLPKYRGRTPHVWAIINNEKETGITAHMIDEGCDEGEIVAQKKFTIGSNDTGSDILNLYSREYPEFVMKVLRQVQEKSFTTTKQNNVLATYFGKRTPEDGRIDWNWQRERIYNWVRALARPYPGAFSYSNLKKIIIHRIEFSDIGFHYATPNGTVVGFELGKPLVKTPNGCVRLVDFECDFNVDVNNIFI